MACPMHLCNGGLRWHCSALIYVVNFVPHKETKTVQENLLTTPFNNRRTFISKISKFVVWLFSYCDQEGRIICDFLSLVGSIVILSHKSHKVLELVTRYHDMGCFYYIFGGCYWGCVYRVMVRFFLTHLTGTFKLTFSDYLCI